MYMYVYMYVYLQVLASSARGAPGGAAGAAGPPRAALRRAGCHGGEPATAGGKAAGAKAFPLKISLIYNRHNI